MVDYQRLEGNAGDTSATAAAAPAERSWLPGVGVFFVVVGISVLGFISLQPGPAPPAPPVIAQEESGWKAEPSAVKGARGRLRITNGCAEDDLWLAHFAFQTPYFPQDLKLKSGATHEFAIPDVGLASTRFWPKWGCDVTGANCKIGQSGGPGESCPAAGCAPPVDSKFEATFGCMPGTAECAHNPSAPAERLGSTDSWDVSHVDGWTLPYKVEVVGDCPMAPKTIDCSRLALSSCPGAEDLGIANMTLRLRDPVGSGDTIGCYSPCAKLTYSHWGQGLGFTPNSKEARDFCCPTPPISPAQCSSGPIIRTQFVAAVHLLCPGVYAYAYDDGTGLAQCPAGTRYDVTFYCPQ